MNLWIRSQDKENLMWVSGLRVLENRIQMRGEGAGILTIGEYKTKERALEVLDDIQDFITFNCTFEGFLEYLDVRIKQGILSNMTRIYVMPKE